MYDNRPGRAPKLHCPACRRPNPARLIYCVGEDCAAVPYPGRRTCRECLAALPVLPAVRPGDGAGEGIGAIHGKGEPIQ